MIDQAEELFQGGAPQQEAEGLATLLQEALGPGLRVLLVVRADYLGHLELVKAAGLRQVFERTQLLLPLDATGSRLDLSDAQAQWKEVSGPNLPVQQSTLFV